MNKIPANLLYSPNELERWLDDADTHLSNDNIKAMSVHFDEKNLCLSSFKTCSIPIPAILPVSLPLP